MSYKVCIDKPFMNCEKIYPIQQERVRELIDAVSSDPAVSAVTVFGSSVSSRCGMWSDVDVYIEMDDDHNPVKKALRFPFDLWTNYSVDDRLRREIFLNGVRVYERE